MANLERGVAKLKGGWTGISRGSIKTFSCKKSINGRQGPRSVHHTKRSDSFFYNIIFYVKGRCILLVLRNVRNKREINLGSLKTSTMHTEMSLIQCGQNNN
jgi:hypothetical protein